MAIKTRDITSRLVGHHTGTETALICLKHECDWFLSKVMEEGNADTELDANNRLNAVSNLLLLRSGLHSTFNDRTFVFFPETINGYAIHTPQSTSDVGILYYNTQSLSIPHYTS